MKLLKKILITGVVTIILFYISLHLAERSSGNTAYIFMIAGVLVIYISGFLMDLTFWSSLKTDLSATPRELVNKNIRMEGYYIGEIIMFISGTILLICAYKDYTVSGFDTTSILYFLGSIICFATFIKFIISKKSRIGKMTNINNQEQNNLKTLHRVATFVTIGLIVLGYLYNFFN